MLKKSIAILLSVSILFCFCACNQVTDSSPTTITDTTNESQVETTQNTNTDSNIYIDNNLDVENKIENDYQTTTQNYSNKNTQVYTQKQTTQKQSQNFNTTKQTTRIHQTTHSHSFSSANCTTPKKCNCGVTSGSALGHSYSSATCFSSKTCSRCGATSGSALGHNYKNNQCTRCGKTDPNSLPIGLNNLFLIDSYKYHYKTGSFTDSFGNTYNDVHYYTELYRSKNGQEPHSTFNLRGAYKTFSGSIVASTKTSPNLTYYINIYVDDVLKFSKTGFSKVSGKVDFKIDVSNGGTLKICAGMESRLGDDNPEIGIVNATLSK